MSSDNRNYPISKDHRSLITRQKNGITYFGFINETGSTVIEPQYLNATNFINGRAIVLKLDKIIAGQNDALGKNVVFYEYNEVLINPEGEIIAFLSKEAKNIVLDKDYLRNPPPITFKPLSPSLFAKMNKSKRWLIRKIED